MEYNVNTIIEKLAMYAKLMEQVSSETPTSADEPFKQYLLFKESLGYYDFRSMTRDELIAIGFCEFHTLTDKVLLCIPKYLFNCIPDGTKLTTILGKKVIVGLDKIGMDTRQGCISCGFLINEVKCEENKKPKVIISKTKKDDSTESKKDLPATDLIGFTSERVIGWGREPVNVARVEFKKAHSTTVTAEIICTDGTVALNIIRDSPKFNHRYEEQLIADDEKTLERLKTICATVIDVIERRQTKQ